MKRIKIESLIAITLRCMYIAKCNQTNGIIRAIDLVKSNGLSKIDRKNLTCPDQSCNAPVFLKNGLSNEAHFAHKKNRKKQSCKMNAVYRNYKKKSPEDITFMIENFKYFELFSSSSKRKGRVKKGRKNDSVSGEYPGEDKSETRNTKSNKQIIYNEYSVSLRDLLAFLVSNEYKKKSQKT